MNTLVFCFVVFAVCSAKRTPEKQFEDFITEYGRTYGTNEERNHRLSVFKANLQQAATLNTLSTGANSAEFGVTKFMDLTPDEFRAQYLNGKQLSASNAPVTTTETTQAPAQVDWRTKGVITPVKDQGQCGSCWAFSTVEEIESMWAVAGNKLTAFSPQQVVSCDKGNGDGGCNGGDTQTAMKYVIKAGGLETDADYPYTSGGGKTGVCHFDAAKIAGGKVTSFYLATPECTSGSCLSQNESAVVNAITQTGPASICVNAGPWQTYKSGVMTMAHCTARAGSIDHCVQLVGFDKTSTPGYWIVRNSWGTSWGIQGYIYLQMGENTCSLLSEVVYPQF